MCWHGMGRKSSPSCQRPLQTKRKKFCGAAARSMLDLTEIEVGVPPVCPLRLLEVGSSAGLTHLRWDYYRYMKAILAAGVPSIRR